MANEKMTEYYNFGKESELCKLLSVLSEEEREDYIDGFDELDDATEQKVESFIKQFIDLVYGNKQKVIAKVTDITDQHIELCVTEL